MVFRRGKNDFQTWEKRFSDVGKMIFRRHAIFFQTLSIFLQTSYFFPMKLLQIKKSHLRSSYLENTGKNEKKVLSLAVFIFIQYWYLSHYWSEASENFKTKPSLHQNLNPFLLIKTLVRKYNCF